MLFQVRTKYNPGGSREIDLWLMRVTLRLCVAFVNTDDVPRN